ncbi:MAG: hypothetical protein ACTSXW_01790, partial [Candidatus Baldrarchaeia archaeon]
MKKKTLTLIILFFAIIYLLSTPVISNGEKTDIIQVEIHFPKAYASIAESNTLHGIYGLGAGGAEVNVEDQLYWLTHKHPDRICIEAIGSWEVSPPTSMSAMFMEAELEITAKFKVKTTGNFSYYWFARFDYFNSTNFDDSGLSLEIAIFNATSGDWETLYFNTYSNISWSYWGTVSFKINRTLIDSDGWITLAQYVYYVFRIDNPSTSDYMGVSYIEFSARDFDVDRDPITMEVPVTHETQEEQILHKISVENPEYNTKIIVYKPDEWSFYAASPNATISEYSNRIELTNTVAAAYNIYFTSTDFLNYPRRYETRISYFDLKSQYIPFQSVFTYYNLSWTTVTTPTYQPLYSDTFTMDKAQYLSILVKDRWGTVLLEKKNLEYQEFYNFTLTLYTFKLVSFQDDFIYMMLKPVGAVNWYTEWIAPNEIEEEHLYPGTYNLTIQFKNGTEIHETVDLTTDVTYIVSGWTLSKLAGRVDINFAHFIGVSLKNNYTGLPLPLSDFTFMVNDTVRSISTSELFYIEGDFADIRIYDVFNHLLYHKAVNVTETGWLNIGLNVTHLVLRNPYEIYAVNMTLTASSTGVSKTFIVPPLESRSIFIGNDTYS